MLCMAVIGELVADSTILLKQYKLDNVEEFKSYEKKSTGADCPVLTVDIKNPTKDWQSFTIYKVNLEVGKWSSAVSWDLFSEMNDNSELVWSIPAGKTKTIVIPYVAYRQLMSESDWEKLDQDNMKLRFSVVQGSITVNVK